MSINNWPGVNSEGLGLMKLLLVNTNNIKLLLSIQWIFKISAHDIITAYYIIIMSRTLKVTGNQVKFMHFGCVPLGWSGSGLVIQDLSRSWCIKRTGESTLVMDSPVLLMHHDDPDRSWITNPDPDHPKGMQPLCYFLSVKKQIHDFHFFRSV